MNCSIGLRLDTPRSRSKPTKQRHARLGRTTWCDRGRQFLRRDRRLEHFHFQWKLKVLQLLHLSHFRTENRIPLFLKMLYSPFGGKRSTVATVNQFASSP